MALSGKLNGVVADPGAAALGPLLAAIERTAEPGALRRLAEIVETHRTDDLDAAISATGLDGLANTIVEAWYTGVVTGPGGEREDVLADDALVWRALDFTKAPGQCAIDSWADKPTAAEDDPQ